MPIYSKSPLIKTARLASFLGLTTLSLLGCGGASASAGSTFTGLGSGTVGQVATPTISSAASQSGAVLVTLADATSGAAIYYTTNGNAPSAASIQYFAPFLLASTASIQAIGVSSGMTTSAVATQAFTASIASGTLVWSDEFSNATGANINPNSAVWTYDTGASGYGNHELEDYCAAGSSVSPCSASSPNAFVGTDGYLHIVARQPTPGVYTSARMRTQGRFSFQYGRLEFRAQVPEAQGLWPAGWLMGNNIASVNWPACGEMDVLERVNAATTPDFNQGSVHGPGFTGIAIGTAYHFPTGQTAATWHTYGMIWTPGSVAYYVDSPSNIYATFSSANLTGYPGAAWPFDGGQSNFILLNLAVGGDYPGAPTSSTPFPSELLVDYVRLYTY
jgi:beta-glucanase (GH16 family)